MRKYRDFIVSEIQKESWFGFVTQVAGIFILMAGGSFFVAFAIFTYGAPLIPLILWWFVVLHRGANNEGS